MAIVQIGNSSKNKTYLRMMKERTKDKKHPRNMGVKMQAHHVISGDGVVLSGTAEKLVKFGYDINLEKNLVFIPCTLQGACYLGVQPHRGNHTAVGKTDPDQSEDDYDDDAEPRPYHTYVSDSLIKAARDFPKTCKKSELGKNKATDLLDELAQDLLDLIQDHPDKLPLTSVAEHFKRRSKIGCGGCDSVPDLDDESKEPVPCAVGRKHNKDQRKGQREEKISYDSDGKYKLIMGK